MKNKSSRPAALKINNCKTIIELFREHDCLTITDLANLTSLSKTTIINLFEVLKEKKFIKLLGKGESTISGGKRPSIYEYNKDMGCVLTILILKNGLLFSRLNAASELEHKTIEYFEGHSDIEEIVTLCSKYCNEQIEYILKENRIVFGISIAFQGVTNSVTGCVEMATNYPNWEYHTPVISPLKKMLKYDVPIFFDNQHRISILAEKKYLDIKENENIVYLACNDDGIGGSIYVNNRVSYGTNFLAGEIGHMILNPQSDIKCKCGGKGCFQALVSPENVVKMCREKFNYDDITLKYLAQKYKEKDPQITVIVNEIIQWFALAFSNIIVISAPKVIVLSGDYNIFGTKFLQDIKDRIQTISLTRMSKDVEIVFSKLDSNAIRIGSSTLAIDKYFSNDKAFI